MLPILSELSAHPVGTPVLLPADFEGVDSINRQVDPALAYLHHNSVLMYNTHVRTVTVWSSIMRDALRTHNQRSDVAL